jgi:hypothetical protein
MDHIDLVCGIRTKKKKKQGSNELGAKPKRYILWELNLQGYILFWD